MVHSLLILWAILPGCTHPDAQDVRPPSVESYTLHNLPAHAYSPTSTSTILTSGSTWQYLVTAGNPASDWKSNPGYDDTNPPWYGGPSPLGYGGQGASNTTVTSEGGTCVNQCLPNGTPTAPSCLTCSAKSITTYFRKTISLTNVGGSTFSLRYQRDDGIVIYINGTEVIRENLPASPAPISYTTLATAFPSDADEVAWITINPSSYSTLLQDGQNLIAAEVHQVSTTSSDIRFNMELIQTVPASGTFTTGAYWQYLVTAGNPTSDWKSNPGYDDTNPPWYGGPSPLGYGGQGASNTTVTSEGGTCVNQCLPNGTPTAPSCLTCSAKSITTYFRKTISLTNVGGSTFSLRYQRDDGIVIYINGTEVIRENLPASPAPISYTTLATAFPSDADEVAWITINPSSYSTLLQDGQNLIAAEVHQVSTTSSDIRFNMELIQTPNTVSITRGPYLQLGTSSGTTSGATVRWRTNAPTNSRVTFGLSATSLIGGVIDPTSTTEHIVPLSSLQPDQQYFYSVGTTSGVLEQGPSNYFKTAPLLTSKRKIRIATFGDVGSNVNTNQAYVRDAFLKFRRDGGDSLTNLWMLTGDNSYDGADIQYQDSLFVPFRSNLLKNTMLYTVPGNHDYLDYVRYPPPDPAYDRRVQRDIDYYAMFSLPTNAEAGGIPSQSEQYYSFDYGPVHFVMLDSYGKNPVQVNSTSPIEYKAFYEDVTTVGYTMPNAQIAWLKQDLAATSQKWKIVYMHHPPYTRGTHDSESESELINIRQTITPILEGFGVDMVVTGHSHVYERSYPLHDLTGFMGTFSEASNVYVEDRGSGRYDGSPNTCPYKNTSEKRKQGTVYVVSGTSGRLEPHKPDLSAHPAMVLGGTSHKNKGGSFYMEVEDNRLDAKFIYNVSQASGGLYTIEDQFTMMKDVDKTQSFTITNGQSLTLSASFISDYAWSSPGFTAATRSVVVTPTTSATYVVKDSKNCLLDVFTIQVVGSATMFTVKVGNWNDPTVWSGNRIPVSTDRLQIRHNVTIPASLQAHALSVQFDPGVRLSYGLSAQLLLSL